MLHKSVIAAAIATGLLLGAAAPAFAKVYNVVFAGKPVPVDCPESPEGHTLSWVSQTCTAVRIAPIGTTTLGAKGRTLMEMAKKSSD